MTPDLASIRSENRARYGTDVSAYGPILMANLYSERTHFIYELLQNAEDALARRKGWKGSRSVHFDLQGSCLTVRHFGHPFNEADVRSICAIAKSTKGDLNAIGRFGIGFKSVYAVTNRPEVHSANIHFAIEDFVSPFEVPPAETASDETIFILPLIQDPQLKDEIISGLHLLGPRSILFLRSIDTVAWTIDQSTHGSYRRETLEVVDNSVRRVRVTGRARGTSEQSSDWMIFSRKVEKQPAFIGQVEIAFSLGATSEIEPLNESPLVAYFPTAISTGLGFLVQGPYRTTPSRDNVPRDVEWNLHLVSETEELIVQALRWLRDRDKLTLDAIQCLPLEKPPESDLFHNLFERLRNAFKAEPLLPRFNEGYVIAGQALLGRTMDIRKLLSPRQLQSLYKSDQAQHWLSSEITQDKRPALRKYLLEVLEIPEVDVEDLVKLLSAAFLKEQSDGWIVRLYEVLGNQPSLMRWGRLDSVPLIRLESGAHVVASLHGKPQAYLPSGAITGFPTVRQSVCKHKEARAFLVNLGLKEPDLVDDVVRFVAPKYQANSIRVSDSEYTSDLGRIVAAYSTDSTSQRKVLVDVLHTCRFVKAKDAGLGKSGWRLASEVYFPTPTLARLFEGITGVAFIDKPFFDTPNLQELLEVCGVRSSLRGEPFPGRLNKIERLRLRHQAGCESCSTEYEVVDLRIQGLELVVSWLQSGAPEVRSNRASMIWQALYELAAKEGERGFQGSYQWYYFHLREAGFNAFFVHHLNQSRWVPDSSGRLRTPSEVSFDSLSWKPQPTLLTFVHFQPSKIADLAREVGIEPGVIDLLRDNDLTTVEQVRSLLAKLRQATDAKATPTPESISADSRRSVEDLTSLEKETACKDGEARAGTQTFHSYVGTHLENQAEDGSEVHSSRIDLENQAIQLILSKERALVRIEGNNEGFDLIEPDAKGNPIRWIEVKAMRSGLDQRPVSMTRAQYEHARVKGAAYDLYVVEFASDPSRARIHKIRDPEGKAMYYTFDKGWLSVAAPNEDS